MECFPLDINQRRVSVRAFVRVCIQGRQADEVVTTGMHYLSTSSHQKLIAESAPAAQEVLGHLAQVLHNGLRHDHDEGDTTDRDHRHPYASSRDPSLANPRFQGKPLNEALGHVN